MTDNYMIKNYHDVLIGIACETLRGELWLVNI